MSEQTNNFPPSRKRPGESLGSGPDIGPSEHPMETEDSVDTASEHENDNQKKMRKSVSKDELGIESEKSKVTFIRLYFQKVNKQMTLRLT
jgi:hypothetical protein